jgi:hypothetical protein
MRYLENTNFGYSANKMRFTTAPVFLFASVFCLIITKIEATCAFYIIVILLYRVRAYAVV